MPILKMSEARFNDLVYLTLKKLYFEPNMGEGCCPRECDIRVCMNMSQPEMLVGVNPVVAMILSPAEVAPKSHDKMYDVDTDKVFDECKDYMEDHWFKQEMPEDWTKGAKEFFEDVVKVLMTVPEDKCGG